MINLKLVLDVEEALEDFLLLPLADFVLLGPARVQFLIECINFELLLRQHVVHLDLDFVAPLLAKLGSFFL